MFIKCLLTICLAFFISGEWVMKDGAIHRYTTTVESIPDPNWLDDPTNATEYFKNVFAPDLTPDKILYMQHLFIIPK